MEKNIKHNCYECKYRRDIGGDCHSTCVHPQIKASSMLGAAMSLRISATVHGVDNGWFFWPINFDPVWLLNCDGFEKKEDENER